MGKGIIMTHQESGRLGGQALVKKYGVEHMRRIGSRGFWATMEALAFKQTIEPRTPGVNPYRNLLRNLKAKKGVKCPREYM